MRAIEVDTEVFSKIWAHRLEGEESENEILRRLLGSPAKPSPQRQAREDRMKDFETYIGIEAGRRRIRWRDDVKRALDELGGKAPLAMMCAMPTC